MSPGRIRSCEEEVVPGAEGKVEVLGVVGPRRHEVADLWPPWSCSLWLEV